MSDLMGGVGRASNGGARERGPVPVGEGSGTQIRTPTDIMRRRREREEMARLQQVQAQQVGPSGEESTDPDRPAAGVVQLHTPPLTQAAGLPTRHHRHTTSSSGQGLPGRSPSSQDFPPSPEIPVDDPSSSAGLAAIDPSLSARQRPNIQAQNPSRPVPAGNSPVVSRFQTNPTTTGSQPRPAPQPPTAVGVASSSRPTQGTSQAGSVSSFPHAFERWETLSSHWEGLTSYWIRRLEANKQELRREPLLQQMSRQVTDLSQAGANLFHAVVELQRLRASSERRFTRWAHESRKELERLRENEAQLRSQLEAERLARTNEKTRMENMLMEHGQIKDKYQKMINDKDRELDISRGEARRAWEELGRRETEEIERSKALSQGQIAFVAGHQVLPIARHISTGHSASSSGVAGGATHIHTTRPVTRDGGQAPPPLHGMPASGVGEPQQPSPSNTDPFAETTTVPQVFTTQPPTTNGIHASTSASQPTSLPPSFYQHAPTLLHQHPQQQHPHHGHHQQHHHPHAARAAVGQVPVSGVSSAGSEAPSWHPSEETNSEEGDEEIYEYDEHGSVRRDEFGQPIMHRRGHVASDDDDLDIADELERERIMRAQQRYAAPPSGISYPSVPTSTTSRILPTVAVSSPPMPTTAAPPPPVPTSTAPHLPTTYSNTSPVDYEGAGYDWDPADPAQFPGRPGRPLSDVVELDEDQRSRVSEMSHATHKASASQASAGEGVPPLGPHHHHHHHS